VEGLRDEGAAELRRLETLLGRCEHLRPDALPFEELRELARLYRRATQRLARLRERDDDPEAIRSLNALCVRGFTHLSVAPRTGPTGPPPLLARLPGALARTVRAQALAWALLLAGIYVGAVLVAHDPRAAYALVPASLGYPAPVVDRLLTSAEARREFFGREDTPAGANFFFGSYLFANNTRVGLLAFATGVLAGIPTLLLGLYNGLLVGAFGAIFFHDPWPVLFLAWILPHGIPELGAVTLCVAAGLVLGGAVAIPGRRSRRSALQEATDSALLLFATALPLFLLAALIESFVRESLLSTGARLAVAGVMAALVLAGGLASWRLARRGEREPPWLHELGPAPE
jgi:uncharacterized membrane protein SpoIIM required for sporulation